jgi:CRP-like cAMP-binding protein
MKQKEIYIPFCDSCAIRSSSVFKNLSKDEIELINFEKDYKHFSRGDLLYSEGNRLNGFFCINKGIIKVYKTGIDGKEQIIRFAKQGDIIAYRSILSNEPACTSAKVIEDASTCHIPAKILIDFAKENSAFSMDVMKLTCHELGEANAYITDIAQKTVRERLAEIIIHLIDEFGLDSENYLNISLTREELANIVGTATESVIRLLSEFKSDSYIELKGRKIKILDKRALEKISNVFN